MKKHKIGTISDSFWKTVLVGALMNALFYSVTTLIFAVVSFMSDDPTGRIKMFSVIALLLTGAACGAVMGRLFGGVLKSVLSTLIFALAMLGVGLLFSGGVGIGNAVNCALFVALSALTAKIATHTGKKSKFKPQSR